MLIKEGYQCYLTGGAVRDIVRGEVPHDYDLATDAKPGDMLNIFPKSVSVGAKFGMVMALVPDKKGENFEVEVTTFRSEEDYVDGRWPSKVTFVNDIDKDLGRRDFTWNAMAIDLSTNNLDGDEGKKEWEIYDPFDGVQDIGMGVVRAVGTPIERFKEDGLRAIKACRMASQLQFDIEDETLKAVTEAIPVVKLVSMERVRDEFVKLIMGSPKPSHGIELMRQTGLLELYIPELVECYGVEQKLYHGDDVYWHALRCCDVSTDKVKLAALFHDIGKPVKDTKDGHFYGHDIESERLTRKIMKRLRFSNKEIDRTAKLVRNHMFFFPHYTENMSKEERKAMEEREWTDGAIRRFIARVGEENLEDLFALRVADAASNPKTAFMPDEIEQLQARISEVRQKDMALKVTDLDISGNDLMELGVEKGPEIGRILNELFERVLDDPLLNTKEKLIAIAKGLIDRSG
ncbi:HD domain-containing protein [Candidatus Dojkabacteria bacterium]|nr:HD domain-containing protein [Candidatus Dojkabacteria bacterium]